MTYANMTALELRELVTRLEAHGFKVPEGIYSYFDSFGEIVPVPFAAAIIEVTARDWWIRQDHENDLVVQSGNTWARDAEDTFRGPTPLHAIAAALEAK